MKGFPFRLSMVVVLGAMTAPGVMHAQAPVIQRPTRDPHTPGYVKAIQLPDGVNPPLKDGNYILGP